MISFVSWLGAPECASHHASNDSHLGFQPRLRIFEVSNFLPVGSWSSPTLNSGIGVSRYSYTCRKRRQKKNCRRQEGDNVEMHMPRPTKRMKCFFACFGRVLDFGAHV